MMVKGNKKLSQSDSDRPNLFFDRFYQEGGYEHYNSFDRQLYWARKEQYAEIINGLAKGLRVIDVGCGDGDLLRLLPQTLEIYGLDVSILALKEARQFCSAVFCGLADRLPCADNAFDMVLFMETIYHVTNPLECLKEIRRVMRPDSRLLMSAHLSNPPWIHLGLIISKMLGRYSDKSISTYDSSLWPQDIYSLSTVRQFLKRAGFVMEREVPTIVPVPIMTRNIKYLPFLEKLGRLYSMFSINTLFICRLVEDT